MGFVSKYSVRDSKLPIHRNKLLDNVLNDFKSDPQVLGIVLGGSLAKGNADRYSDIDLHIIVKPDSKPDFIREKRERSKKWGNVLYFEGSDHTPVLVTHYECFVKIDTFYKEPKELTPSIWLKGLQALYDPHGIISKVLEQSAKLDHRPAKGEVEFWREKIFAFFHETYRAVMRNESYYALANLDKIRWLIVSGWYMEAGYRVDSLYGNWSKLEGGRSNLKEWQLSLLAEWDCSRSSQEIMKTVASILPEFFRLNKQLSRKTGLAEKKEWCEKIVYLVL
ncbi:nucleotidyltransferase domain-containing protein [Gracilibacillus caseinilyticus]|uniref:Nucleotidyltransferase domain-containing protein n=1 Tax=Gracilibacillus caseinilyticus TaxID=2932256 RepID=A0ABY4EVY7_9BACI|nr:nucleotidyltransferase domain-containing protein [Gracilibacillus caseinilyticus]UOQ48576.1 nucleotidyltransferase domain-containing protein [Gracilibacillus caseinilyticus]